MRWQSGPMQRFAKPSNRRFESGPHLMYIGIDYGLRKIGVATSEGTYATPLTVISNAPSRVSQLKEKIKDTVDTIVIGIPNSFLDAQVHAFADELKTAFACEIVFEDETNSSKDAMQMMLDSGVPQKKRELDDAYAATVILQHYLDKINESPVE